MSWFIFIKFGNKLYVLIWVCADILIYFVIPQKYAFKYLLLSQFIHSILTQKQDNFNI